ncbi:MAG TPA: hypothetical protein DD670_01200 [Planctomycetaceae bacterium]|nr:hypothetical protein [Planctomycetaceae bacterium]
MVAVSWFLAAVAVLGLLPWRVVAQERLDDREIARQAGQVKGAATEVALLASDKSGDYTVAVDRVRFEPNRLTTSQWTWFPMTPQARSQDSSWKEWSSDDSKQSTRQEGNSRVRTEVTTSAGGMAGGGGGGMGGGFGVSYTRPNLVLDVKVEPSKSRQGKFLLCEVNGKVRATDDLGNEFESPGFPAARRMRMEGVDYPRGSGRTAIHLYRPGASAKASYLRSLEGELLVAEAKQSDFVLQGRELSRGTVKKDQGNTVKLVGFENTAEGVNVALAVSGAPSKNPRDPFERMQRMMTSRSRLNVTLEDTDGRTHEAAQTRSGSGGSSGFRSGGSAGGAAWGSSGGSGGASWGPGGTPKTTGGSDGFSWSSGSGPDGATNEYHFNPLPDGVKVKAIRCTITDRVGEPTAVPFRLKDIRLPDKANRR